MTSVQPIYPNSIFQWTDRIDQQDIDFANDINSAVSEIISIENTIGTTPNTESSPPTGNPIKYNTLSDRISAAANNELMPICELVKSSFVITNSNPGQLNSYIVSYDPINAFNGIDLTIPAPGYWIVYSSQRWSGANDGYSHFSLCLNGTDNIVDDSIINWNFPGNTVTGGIPGRWRQFGGSRSVSANVSWQGLAHKGDRFSGLSENGTSNSGHIINNLTMKAVMVRSVTGSFTTG